MSLKDLKKAGPDQILMMEKSFGEKEPEFSPYVLDLGQKAQRKTSRPEKLFDLSLPFFKPQSNEEKYYFPLKLPRLFSKKRELFQLAALGIIVVFLLNLGGVYYRGDRLKKNVVEAAASGYLTIFQGGKEVYQSDLEKALTTFDQAFYDFEMAKKNLWFLNNQRTSLKLDLASKTAQNLILSGENLAAAGISFTQFIQNLNSWGEKIFEEEKTEPAESFTESLKNNFEQNFQPALLNLKTAQTHLNGVDLKLFPEDLKPEVALAQEKLQELVGVFEEIETYFPLVLKILGDEHPKRYLILLQNNQEARPGGGFIGSFLLLDLNDGRLENLEVRDVYAQDGLLQEYIEPPGEIALLSRSWRLRDSNYSPDFPTWAKKAAWFLEKEKGPGVDSVLAVDLTLGTKLLELLGPIEIESLGKPLTAENFSLILTYIIEAKLSGEETPKKILEEFIPAVKEEILRQKSWLKLIALIQEMAAEKHFFAYSKAEEIQDFWRKIGISGKIRKPEPSEDFLMVVGTGIGGNKTDAFITQKITHQTLFQKDGTILNQVTVKHYHGWDNEIGARQREEILKFGFAEIPGIVEDILGRGPNVTALRVYVPKGSTLENVLGTNQDQVEVKYDPDLDLTYFYTTLEVFPQNSTQITFTYRLPFKLNFSPVDNYYLTVLKQPGRLNSKLVQEFLFDPGLKNYRLYPPEMVFEDEIWRYQTNLETDQYLSGVFGRE